MRITLTVVPAVLHRVAWRTALRRPSRVLVLAGLLHRLR